MIVAAAVIGLDPKKTLVDFKKVDITYQGSLPALVTHRRQMTLQ